MLRNILGWDNKLPSILVVSAAKAPRETTIDAQVHPNWMWERGGRGEGEENKRERKSVKCKTRGGE